MTSAAKAVVLLSGGLDSTTILAVAKSKGFDCYCLSFAYGQRQRIELDKAKQIAASFLAKAHLVLRLDLDKIGGSALTTDMEVPKDLPSSGHHDSIPVTYVPGRNLIFLSHALAWAEVLGASDIFIGVNAVDYSGYPDCRPEFIEAFVRAANLGTRKGVQEGEIGGFHIHTPLIRLSKAEIIELGFGLGVDYSLTHTCYDPDEKGRACGRCEACRLRLKGFAEAGRRDPIVYSNHKKKT